MPVLDTLGKHPFSSAWSDTQFVSKTVRLKDIRDSKLTDRQRSGSMLWVGGWGWCWLGEFRAIGSKRSDDGDKDANNAAWGKADWLIGRRKSISA